MDSIHSHNSPDFIQMVADHMENGFLENIVDMFKHDTTLYETLPRLISDERIVVRLGTTALVETLHEEDPENVMKALPYLLSLLEHDNPNVRGDSVSLVGLIAQEDITDKIKPLLDDENANVRILAEEAIEDIRKRNLSRFQ